MERDKKSKIEDIQKFRELKEMMSSVESFVTLAPVLESFGVDLSGIENLENIEDLKEEVRALISMPDKFNNIFAERGWIAYENLNADVANEAIEIAQKQSIEKADEYLAKHYDNETLEFHFMSMKAIEPFRLRYDLLQKAKTDYIEEHYYAAVPIILSCLDGIVNDVAKKNRGFFAEGIDLELEAWNSISAHSQGLGKLVSLLQTARKKTSVKEITIPFRHGILHGRDINYDNKLIAAKSWAALFSIRDWALSVKHDRKPEEKEDFSWKDLKKQLQKNKETRKALDTWESRKQGEIQKVIESKDFSSFKEGTPEFKVWEFMEAWRNHNYGAMYDILPTNIKKLKKRSTSAGEMRRKFEDHKLIDFKILEIDEFAPASCKIKVDVEFEYDGIRYENELTYQLLHLDKNGNPAISRIQDGEWGFTPEIFY